MLTKKETRFLLTLLFWVFRGGNKGAQGQDKELLWKWIDSYSEFAYCYHCWCLEPGKLFNSCSIENKFQLEGLKVKEPLDKSKESSC